MSGRRRAAVAATAMAGTVAFAVVVAGPASAAGSSTGQTSAVYVQAGGGAAPTATTNEVGNWPVLAARAAYYAGRASYAGFKAATSPRAVGEVTRNAGIGFPFAASTGSKSAVAGAEQAFDR